MFKQFIETSAYIVIILGGMGLFLYVASVALTRHEVMECVTWREQADRYNGWYATQAERNQCVAVGIELPPNKK